MLEDVVHADRVVGALHVEGLKAHEPHGQAMIPAGGLSPRLAHFRTGDLPSARSQDGQEVPVAAAYLEKAATSSEGPESSGAVPKGGIGELLRQGFTLGPVGLLPYGLVESRQVVPRYAG